MKTRDLAGKWTKTIKRIKFIQRRLGWEMEHYNNQMRRGGKREGAGRKSRPLIPQVSQGIASRVLTMPEDEKTGWPGEEGRWLELLNAKDERLRFDVQKYLTDRR